MSPERSPGIRMGSATGAPGQRRRIPPWGGADRLPSRQTLAAGLAPLPAIGNLWPPPPNPRRGWPCSVMLGSEPPMDLRSPGAGLTAGWPGLPHLPQRLRQVRDHLLDLVVGHVHHARPAQDDVGHPSLRVSRNSMPTAESSPLTTAGKKWLWPRMGWLSLGSVVRPHDRQPWYSLVPATMVIPCPSHQGGALGSELKALGAGAGARRGGVGHGHVRSSR